MFLEINEDIVQCLLMLKVLFTQDSEVEDLFYGASLSSKPSLFFSNNLFSLELSLVKMTFGMPLLGMIDKTNWYCNSDKAVGCPLREFNNQRLSPRGRPFSCYQDRVKGFCKNICHNLHACLNKFWYIISSCRFPLFQCSFCNLNFLTKDWLKIFSFMLTAVQNCIVSIC